MSDTRTPQPPDSLGSRTDPDAIGQLMASLQATVRSPQGPVSDHPVGLGRLAPIFARRRIALGADTRGKMVLLRPDSVIVDVASGVDLVAAVAAIVATWDETQASAITGNGVPRSGVVAVDLTEPSPTEICGEVRWSVEPVRCALAQFAANGITAEPNHVLIGSQSHVPSAALGFEANYAADMCFMGPVGRTKRADVLFCTAHPAPAVEMPDPLRLEGRRRPRVLVIDSGIRTEAGLGLRVEHPALRDFVTVHQPWVDVDTGADNEDRPDSDDVGAIDFEAGHGTFVVGVLRQCCPDAEVHVAGAMSSFGDSDVGDVIAALERSADRLGQIDVILMPFGGYMTDDESAAFGAAIRRLRGDAVIVSSAGNQRTSRPYFPAAMPDVIAVGALADRRPADFTNFGPWVDACAPGVDVVSTYLATGEICVDGLPPRVFDGWAMWSGTSFAAPRVAGAIAFEMYSRGTTAAAAWSKLSSRDRYHLPDLGVIVN